VNRRKIIGIVCYANTKTFEPDPNGVAIGGREAERLWRPRIDPHGNEKLRQILTNMKALPLWD